MPSTWPEARSAPSGEKARASASASWPVRRCKSVRRVSSLARVCRFQTRIAPSVPAAARTSFTGERATVWTFCACWSMTPHDIAGGLRPRPRNDSPVSLMIIAGSASVVAAMMWLVNDGTMWTKMMRS